MFTQFGCTGSKNIGSQATLKEFYFVFKGKEMAEKVWILCFWDILGFTTQIISIGALNMAKNYMRLEQIADEQKSKQTAEFILSLKHVQ